MCVLFSTIRMYYNCLVVYLNIMLSVIKHSEDECIKLAKTLC